METKLLVLVALVATATAQLPIRLNIDEPGNKESTVLQDATTPATISSVQTTPAPTSPAQTTPAQTTPTQTTPAGEVEQFLKSMVEEMNKYRMMHASPPLRINYDMTNQAELWAVKLANNDASSLNVDAKFGQAVFVSNTPDDIVNATVRSWYNQIRYYNYNRPERKTKSSFFTQLVWMSTQEVGVGKATSASGKTYIVAYFDPPSTVGNMADNVLPVTGSGIGKRGPSECEEGYKFVANNCYKFFPGPRTWESAIQRCTEQFASLVTIESSLEQAMVKSMLTTNKRNYTWIGASDINEPGMFSWVDGMPFHFTNWDMMQEAVNGQKCVVVGESFNWRYVPCSKGLGFVCKRRLRDVTTYEITIRYVNKLWTDSLQQPSSPRYNALTKHISDAVNKAYQDADWFDNEKFVSFSKDEQAKIIAKFQITFTPDNDSPADPLENLRNEIQGAQKNAAQNATSKRTLVKGILYGEEVQIINITLVIEQAQAVQCPGFCAAQQCQPVSCNPSCCDPSSSNYQQPSLTTNNAYPVSVPQVPLAVSPGLLTASTPQAYQQVYPPQYPQANPVNCQPGISQQGCQPGYAQPVNMQGYPSYPQGANQGYAGSYPGYNPIGSAYTGYQQDAKKQRESKKKGNEERNEDEKESGNKGGTSTARTGSETTTVQQQQQQQQQQQHQQQPYGVPYTNSYPQPYSPYQQHSQYPQTGYPQATGYQPYQGGYNGYNPFSSYLQGSQGAVIGQQPKATTHRQPRPHHRKRPGARAHYPQGYSAGYQGASAGYQGAYNYGAYPVEYGSQQPAPQAAQQNFLPIAASQQPAGYGSVNQLPSVAGYQSYQAANQMQGQYPYQQTCLGACGNSCAPACLQACCRSSAARLRLRHSKH